MKACIVSVGNELLNGHTVDTNASWLAGRLFEMGIETAGVWLVPDEKERIVKSLNDAAQLGELILVTGGLGPTDDDLTREAVAAFLKVQLEMHQALLDRLAAFFETRGLPMAEKNRSQVFIPSGCEILDNPRGTAAGFWAQKEDFSIAVMPGVPAEMKSMFENEVLPRIQRFISGPVTASGKVRCFGAGESMVAQKLGDLMSRNRNPLINCTCGSGEILLHIIARAEDRKKAQQMVQKDRILLTEVLGEWVYGYDDESLPVCVSNFLRKSGKTIALAESCTGGLLGKMLTDIPGSSDYFQAGWIAYSNEAKRRFLSVPGEIIEKYGAVSREVAGEMATRASQIAGADIGIGITGIAGPEGGSVEKPIGLVCIGLSMNGKTEVQEYRFPPVNRDFVRHRSAMAALNMLRIKLLV